MSTSEFEYLVATDSSLVCATDEPLDALSARLVLNNVCHLSDEFAQVRVRYRAAKNPYNPIAPPLTPLYSEELYISWVFPVTQRQSGDSYKFRIRIAGNASGTTTGSYFRAVIGPYGASGPLRLWGGAGDRDFKTAAPSASTAWLTGTSQGPAASPDLIYLPASLMEAQMYSTATAPTIGGTDTSLQIPLAQLSIYGTASATSGVLQLDGVELAEYVGL